MSNTKLIEIKDRLSANPGVVLEALAEKNGLSAAQVIECLPASMWKKRAGSDCIEVLQALPALGDVTVIVHTADGIFEFGGRFPEGEMGHGFYNLKNPGGLHGHLRVNRCQYIYLVERPFMGRDSASLLFTNQEGGIMFKVFAGRNADGALNPLQLAALRQLCGAPL